MLREQRADHELREQARLHPLDQPPRAACRPAARRTRSPTAARARAPRARRRTPRRAARVSSSSRAPSRADCSTRPCSSSSCSVASPAAIASSFGANVEPWLTACSIESNTRLVHRARHQQRADRHVAARERLRDRHEIRLEPPVLEREHLPGPAEAGLHLVDAEERAVAAAELLRALEVARRRQVHALALDRLDEEDGDVLAAQLLLERVEVAERHALEAGQQRPEPVGELGVPVRRERAERQPVEARGRRRRRGCAPSPRGRASAPPRPPRCRCS